MYLLIIAMLMVGSLMNRSVQRYDYVLDSWAGQSEEKLVMKWGVPSETLEADGGGSIYVYSKTGKALTGRTKLCVSRFILDESDTIVGSNYYGEDCFGLYGDKYI